MRQLPAVFPHDVTGAKSRQAGKHKAGLTWKIGVQVESFKGGHPSCILGGQILVIFVP